MKELWDTRYKSEEFIYGLEPNDFLKSYLTDVTPGKILLPGDGEGRNAVYAAKLGWDVTAFDYSDSAKDKAVRLAVLNNVQINYYTIDVESFNFNEKFDLISIIYLHLHPTVRSNFHKRLSEFLNPGGKVLLECFSKSQIKNSSGGPKSPDLLYDIAQIKKDFSNYKIEMLEQTEIDINEGHLHQGKASVIRMIAQKI